MNAQAPITREPVQGPPTRAETLAAELRARFPGETPCGQRSRAFRLALDALIVLATGHEKTALRIVRQMDRGGIDPEWHRVNATDFRTLADDLDDDADAIENWKEPRE